MASDSETIEVNPVDAVIERATEVIGDREDALRWLGTPVRALGYATPISLLSSPSGASEVLAALARLEHGIL
jgi:putative toxin-antitoxin system antitoxin component (TIGR02293 family)